MDDIEKSMRDSMHQSAEFFWMKHVMTVDCRPSVPVMITMIEKLTTRLARHECIEHDPPQFGVCGVCDGTNTLLADNRRLETEVSNLRVEVARLQQKFAEVAVLTAPKGHYE